jgi:hypothetical protein
VSPGSSLRSAKGRRAAQQGAPSTQFAGTGEAYSVTDARHDLAQPSGSTASTVPPFWRDAGLPLRRGGRPVR